MPYCVVRDLLINIIIDVSECLSPDNGDHDPRPVVHQPSDLLSFPLVREHRAYVTWTC